MWICSKRALLPELAQTSARLGCPDFGQISAQVGLLNRFPAHQAGQPRSALPCRSPGSPRRWSRSLPSSPLCQ